jgi:hypothetical protein
LKARRPLLGFLGKELAFVHTRSVHETRGFVPGLID